MRASFAAFIQHEGKFFEGEPMTVPEFRAFDPSTIAVAPTQGDLRF
jgi:hypothetical protein